MTLESWAGVVATILSIPGWIALYWKWQDHADQKRVERYRDDRKKAEKRHATTASRAGE